MLIVGCKNTTNTDPNSEIIGLWESCQFNTNLNANICINFEFKMNQFSQIELILNNIIARRDFGTWQINEDTLNIIIEECYKSDQNNVLHLNTCNEDYEDEWKIQLSWKKKSLKSINSAETQIEYIKK